MKIILFVALLLSFVPYSHAGVINSIRINETGENARIVFDLDRLPGYYRVYYLPSPDRVVIDIENFSTTLPAEQKLRHQLVKSIRIGRRDRQDVRAVIDLNHPVSFSEFVLKPIQGKGPRLVLDITANGKTVTEKQLPPVPEAVNIKTLPVTELPRKPKSEPVIEPLPVNTEIPTFSIEGFVVEGANSLNEKQVVALLEPFAGHNKDFGDVQRVIEKLQSAYLEAGYGMVQVYLPEQELNEGMIKLMVIEPRLSVIEVPEGQYFDNENIQQSLPALMVNKTPNTRTIAENLALANTNPSKQTRLQFIPSGKENELKASIVVEEKDPVQYAVHLDNTGTSATGEYRIGFSGQHANITDNDDVLTGQFTTSDKGASVMVLGLGYHLPLYKMNSTLDVFAGLSDVDSGTVENLFNVSGKGTILGLRFGKNLQKHGDYTHNLSFGIDYRAYDNAAVPVGGGSSVVPDVTVHPYSLSYSGQWTGIEDLFGFNVQWVQNFAGGKNGEDADFANSRTGATADYSLLRFGTQYARAFPYDWQARFVLTGQYTNDALVAGEQFGAGGATSVRGYEERALANDKGVQGNLELYTPDFASWMGFAGNVRALAFYDFGYLSRNNVQAGESQSDSIHSVGAGLRINYKDIWNLNLDAAYVLEDGGSSRQGDSDVHFSLEYRF